MQSFISCFELIKHDTTHGSLFKDNVMHKAEWHTIQSPTMIMLIKDPR